MRISKKAVAGTLLASALAIGGSYTLGREQGYSIGIADAEQAYLSKPPRVMDVSGTILSSHLSPEGRCILAIKYGDNSALLARSGSDNGKELLERLSQGKRTATGTEIKTTLTSHLQSGNVWDIHKVSLAP